jgi:hypothetical protein
MLPTLIPAIASWKASVTVIGVIAACEGGSAQVYW